MDKKTGDGITNFHIVLFLLAILAVMVYFSVTESEIDVYDYMRFSEDQDTIVVSQFYKKLDVYLSKPSSIIEHKEDYALDKYGVNKLMDDYRKNLKKALGKELYVKYLEHNAFDVHNVTDSDGTLNVEVLPGKNLIYDYDYKNHPDYGSETQKRELSNLLMGLSYMYKDDFNIHVTLGYFGRDKYNKEAFIKRGNEYLFKRTELSKVVNWDDYSYDNLLKLNEYKK